jgi:hypothetical protein
MLDLYEEFAVLIDALENAKTEYAVCGGLAMAIHGLPRATIDVDLIAPAKAGDQVLDIAHRLGYTISAEPMTFAAGAVPIRRVTKIDSTVHDLLSLDLLLVTPATESAWQTRMRVRWERGEVWVVSRQGLVSLKRLRGSGQDQDDIRRLEEVEP